MEEAKPFEVKLSFSYQANSLLFFTVCSIIQDPVVTYYKQAKFTFKLLRPYNKKKKKKKLQCYSNFFFGSQALQFYSI